DPGATAAKATGSTATSSSAVRGILVAHSTADACTTTTTTAAHQPLLPTTVSCPTAAGSAASATGSSSRPLSASPRLSAAPITSRRTGPDRPTSSARGCRASVDSSTQQP